MLQSGDQIKEIKAIYSMMLLVQTLLLVLLSEGVYTAPVRMQEEGDTSDDVKDGKLDNLLKEALLNNTANLENIKKEFNKSSLSVKVCGEITYQIFCDENCCSSTDHNIAWATVDPTTLSGRFLYEFALYNWTVPWFEWEGACDLKTSLLIDLASLPNFRYNDSEIRASLIRLTPQIPSFADSSETARLYYLPEKDDSGGVVYSTFYIAWFLSIVALVTVYSQANTKSTGKRKPKTYFQFWGFHLSALLLLSYTAYLNNQSSFTEFLLYGLAGHAVTIWFVFGLHLVDAETLTHCCRCSQCFCISHSILLISAFLLLVFAMYFIFSIPTIILVYYLYPTRTLIRLPLIINAILYINSLLALLLFQGQRCCHLCCVGKNPSLTGLRTCLTTCKSKWRRHRQLTPEDDSTGPPQQFQHTGIFKGLLLCKGLLYFFKKVKCPGPRAPLILVYYLYPTQTLVRLPLIINAVLYISSLLALLLFQCERCCYLCTRYCVASLTGLRTCLTTCKFKWCRRRQLTPEDDSTGPPQQFQHTGIFKGLLYFFKKVKCPGPRDDLKEIAETHDQYYEREYDNLGKKNWIAFATYICHPIATLLILIIFIFLVIIASELLDLQRQSSNSDLKLLLTLVPTLVLLFGSWYKLHVFFDIEKEKLKKGLLEEIQELKESSNQPSRITWFTTRATNNSRNVYSGPNT